MLRKPRIIVFASGTKDGGGSGFGALIEGVRKGILDASIVGVVSNHLEGGVRRRADEHHIPFLFFEKNSPPRRYRAFLDLVQAEWVILSGWLLKVPVRGKRFPYGLDPTRTINMHPGILRPRSAVHCGGKGMYGISVQERSLTLYRRGLIRTSELAMHFVTARYDAGPVFFRAPVSIHADDTPQTLMARVKKKEHMYEAWVTNLVVHQKIRWDGVNPASLVVPLWYTFQKPLNLLS